MERTENAYCGKIKRNLKYKPTNQFGYRGNSIQNPKKKRKRERERERKQDMRQLLDFSPSSLSLPFSHYWNAQRFLTAIVCSFWVALCAFLSILQNQRAIKIKYFIIIFVTSPLSSIQLEYSTVGQQPFRVCFRSTNNYNRSIYTLETLTHYN